MQFQLCLCYGSNPGAASVRWHYVKFEGTSDTCLQLSLQ